MTAQGLHGALVFSTRCAVKLSGFDFSAALATPGVVAILTSDDIPVAGVNSIADKYPLFIPIGSDGASILQMSSYIHQIRLIFISPLYYQYHALALH